MRAQRRLELMISLVNQTKADLIVFCGHTLFYQDDIKELITRIENFSSTVLFEVKTYKENKFINMKNCLYLIQNGNIRNLYTHQLFSTSDEIENNEDLGERLINELESRRRFQVGDKLCMVIQCGENNIIRNIQNEGNRAAFRFPNRPDLEERFNKLLQHTDIILNPIHTPMGNLDKMKKRMQYLSNNHRYYFSVSQNGTKRRKDDYYELSMDSKSLQYAYYNENPIDEIFCDKSNDYIKRIYKIEKA